MRGPGSRWCGAVERPSASPATSPWSRWSPSHRGPGPPRKTGSGFACCVRVGCLRWPGRWGSCGAGGGSGVAAGCGAAGVVVLAGVPCGEDALVADDHQLPRSSRTRWSWSLSPGTDGRAVDDRLLGVPRSPCRMGGGFSLAAGQATSQVAGMYRLARFRFSCASTRRRHGRQSS